MRIRKRSGPLVLPSISTTLSHSDPPLLSTTKHEHEKEEEEEGNKRLHPSFEDQHQPFDQVHQTSRTTSSDLELTFIRGNNGWVCCGDEEDRLVVLVEDEKKKKKKKKEDGYLCMMNTNVSTQKMEKKELMKGLEEEEEEEEKMMIRKGFGFGRCTTKINRKKSTTLGGEEEEEVTINSGSGSGVPVLFSSTISSSHDHHQPVLLLHERWCEGVKGFPLKKRRGSNCERKVVGNEEETIRTTILEINKQKKVMKTANSSNKNWVVHDQNDSQEPEEEVEEDHVLLSSSNAKKNEGSRCSRINGRGWRCCQQTLVGYSLCEHHLGKGRLRSTVPSRSTTTAAEPIIKNVETRPVSLIEKREDDQQEDDEQKTSNTMKIENKQKRKKMGMVKARSIRSLLGQTQQHDDDHDYVKV